MAILESTRTISGRRWFRPVRFKITLRIHILLTRSIIYYLLTAAWYEKVRSGCIWEENRIHAEHVRVAHWVRKRPEKKTRPLTCRVIESSASAGIEAFID